MTPANSSLRSGVSLSCYMWCIYWKRRMENSWKQNIIFWKIKGFLVCKQRKYMYIMFQKLSRHWQCVSQRWIHNVCGKKEKMREEDASSKKGDPAEQSLGWSGWKSACGDQWLLWLSELSWLTGEAVDGDSVGVVESFLAVALVLVQHKSMTTERQTLWTEPNRTSATQKQQWMQLQETRKLHQR